jgi:hypothetical protein
MEISISTKSLNWHIFERYCNAIFIGRFTPTIMLEWRPIRFSEHYVVDNFIKLCYDVSTFFNHKLIY